MRPDRYSLSKGGPFSAWGESIYPGKRKKLIIRSLEQRTINVSMILSTCNKEKLLSKPAHLCSNKEEFQAKQAQHGRVLRISSKHNYCGVRVPRELGYYAAITSWSIQSKWSWRMISRPIIALSLSKIVLFIRAQVFMP